MQTKADLPDDRHPWEITNPSEWLQARYFAAGSVDWVDEARKTISDGWIAAKKKERVISDAQINCLKHIVARYIHMRVYWDEFLNEGEATKLLGVAAAARNLIKKLRTLESSDGDEKDASLLWYLLGSHAGDFASNDDEYRLFLENLEALSAIAIKSPRIKSDKRLKISKSLGIKAQTSETEIVSRVQRSGSPRLAAGLRGELQGSLDDWWTRVTKLSISKTLEKSPAYAKFLKDIYGRIRLTNPPGDSETAIANARRAYQLKEKDRKHISERYEKLVARFESTY